MRAPMTPATAPTTATTTTTNKPVDNDRFVPAAGGAIAKPQPTALEKHLGFFESKDADGKGQGYISYGSAAEGLQKLGVPGWKAWPGAVAVVGLLGVRMNGSPFSIDIDAAPKGKHTGDTGIYDANGRFDQAKFDEMFAKYDANKDNALSDSEVETFLNSTRKDFFGKLATKLELPVLLKLFGEDKDGEKVVTREAMMKFYDGTLFYDRAGETAPFAS